MHPSSADCHAAVVRDVAGHRIPATWLRVRVRSLNDAPRAQRVVSVYAQQRPQPNGRGASGKCGGEDFNAFSAGLQPTEIDAMTREVLQEIGLEMEGQHAKSVRTYLGKLMVHHLIVVCEAANRDCPHTWPGLEVEERLFWPTASAFREFRAGILHPRQPWAARLDPVLSGHCLFQQYRRARRIDMQGRFTTL